MESKVYFNELRFSLCPCLIILLLSPLLEDPRDVWTYDTAVWPGLDPVICKVPNHLSVLALGLDPNLEQLAFYSTYFCSLR